MSAQTREFSAADERAMRRALELAGRGIDTTDPNPRVGCVITRDGAVVGEGWHARAGEPHAEVWALRAAAGRAAGATVYVTLEPCAHFGRTPPCADALVAAGVGRVVYAVRDPNPLVDGQGARRLAAAGIRVEEGLLAAECAALNVGWLRRQRGGRPWVRLKQAMSVDGRIALASGESRWITGPAAREDVQRWRARSSCILTGSGTVLADDPALTVRVGPEPRRQPLRVVLDSRLRTPPGARLLSEPGATLLIAAANPGSVDPPADDSAAAARLQARGARIERVARAGGGLDLAAVLAELALRQVNELWIEAGPRLAGAWLASGLVDEWLIYVAPTALGDAAQPLLRLAAPAALEQAARFTFQDVQPFGEDLRLILRPVMPQPSMSQPTRPRPDALQPPIP